LRFLQDFRYRPLGAARDEPANIRIISATNVNLDHAVAQKQFRSDLLYRLKIFSITLPALRDRPGDAELLAKHFLRLYCEHYHLADQCMNEADIKWIRGYAWPGNVRELESVVHRALVQSREKSALEFDHAKVPRPQDPARISEPDLSVPRYRFRTAKAAAVQAFERSFIEQVLQEARGNISAAARLSGKERRAFGKLVKKHGFTKYQFFEQQQ
jgi:DNA-binding NtrC family response regulator